MSHSNLYIVSHPLVQEKLGRMRQTNCPTGEFRRLLRELSMLMGYEATKDLPLTHRTIETPVETAEVLMLEGVLPVVVPILRAGLGIAEGIIDLIPDCKIGHIGVYRDEETHRPVEYLIRLPEYDGGMYILTDPMLATGHSCSHAVKILIDHGVPVEKIILICLVAAPEGVTHMAETFKDVRIFAASLDRGLNEKAYIMPGLGDAGDRLFGTL